ncbi:expressed unknown protein [Seminavis robusta]|uniref:Uncharacterized protein n=1 Tax=Seminavis robusta TaxID=568900 RepID=A0A9N8D7E9_9STRA|nr:expressed unknown protein [Seminavis robusta]|eukprot:Sro25_g017360.1 n/a (170) ;mRNA; f:165584-166203
MSFPLRAIIRSPMAARLLATRPVVRSNLVAKAFFSDSITYSGGQASEGQGGFYGSGGARAAPENTSQEHDNSEEERSKMLAMAADVQSITHTMQELETLEQFLQREETENPGQVSGRSIELKNSIKKLMTNPEVLDTLNRLELNGSPVWGLSMAERQLVELARDKVNEC